MPRAIVCEKIGDPLQPVGSGVLKLQQDFRQPAALKPGQIRVAVVAGSVNFADALVVKGEYQVKVEPPFVPGAEGSGTVLECGPGVSRLKPGDKVAFFGNVGAYAEECVVSESVAWKIPDGVDVATAAAVPVTYGTADVALRHRANLQPGQTVLVLGASGGVGLAAVQIAKAVGAHVIAVTKGPAKAQFLSSQGADVVVDTAALPQGQPLHQAIKQHAPRGVHVVIDPVGGPFFSEALKSIAWGGHLVVIGFAAGGIPKVPANILLVKNATVSGLWWGSYLQHNPQVLHSSMAEIMQWLAQGKLKPHVSHRFPLEKVPEAFKTLLTRKAMGKVLITVSNGAAPQSKL